MNCICFRDQYSEFADGFLDEVAEIAMICHITECEACRRFDAAYRAGSSALRELPGLVVPTDFHDRLQARILATAAGLDPLPRRSAWPVGAALTLAILAVAGWQVANRPAPSATRHPATFMLNLVGDSIGAWPGGLPMIPLSRDTFRTSTRPADSFQIAVDYMFVR